MYAKKRFGQNFLQDANIIARIIASIAPQKTDQVLEVGPGHGEITARLLPQVQRLDVVEIDRDLIPGLLNLAAQHPALHVHNQDILKFDLASLSTQPQALRIVGNLPYNISSPLLFHLMEFKSLIKDIHVMLQDEVVERIVAEPDTEHYGRLSVMLQYHCQVQKLFTVPPGAFKPAPQVDSAIVRLVPLASPVLPARDYTIFYNIVKAAFAQRRKMVRNTLKLYLDEADFQTLGISPMARAEILSVEDYVKMANFRRCEEA